MTNDECIEYINKSAEKIKDNKFLQIAAALLRKQVEKELSENS